MRNAPVLLAIDTSTDQMTLALGRGEAVLAVHSSVQKFTQDRALLPALDALLAGQGLSLAEVDVFGVCVGPGTFTGLRVGVTTVKGLCFALGKPAVAIRRGEQDAARSPEELYRLCLYEVVAGRTLNASALEALYARAPSITERSNRQGDAPDGKTRRP